MEAIAPNLDKSRSRARLYGDHIIRRTNCDTAARKVKGTRHKTPRGRCQFKKPEILSCSQMASVFTETLCKYLHPLPVARCKQWITPPLCHHNLIKPCSFRCECDRRRVKIYCLIQIILAVNYEMTRKLKQIYSRLLHLAMSKLNLT